MSKKGDSRTFLVFSFRMAFPRNFNLITLALHIVVTDPEAPNFDLEKLINSWAEAKA